MIAHALSRMPKKSASGLLASLRDSTYRSVRLASSLAAALLDGLFEQPVVLPASTPNGTFSHVVAINQVFQQPVRGRGQVGAHCSPTNLLPLTLAVFWCLIPAWVQAAAT